MSAIAENALIWKLKSVNAINTAVGGRIYPRIAPEGSSKTPYIIIDRPPGQVISQLSNGPASLIKTPMTILCIGATYLESRTIGRLIPAAINPTGVTGSVQWNSTWVDHCTCSQTYEADAPPQMADEIGWPIEAIDVMLFHLDCDSAG